jgi:hypothetical protein
MGHDILISGWYILIIFLQVEEAIAVLKVRMAK